MQDVEDLGGPVLERSAPRYHDRTLPTEAQVSRAERGAVAIEAAFVFTLLFTILAGVVDVSMLFRTTYEVSSASRAGARLAAQEPLAPQLAQHAAVQVASALYGMNYAAIKKLWVYKADPTSPTGEPLSGSACSLNCVQFQVTEPDDQDNPDAPPVVTVVAGAWSGRNACAGTLVDTVGVRVEYQHDAPIMFGEGRLVQETTTMRLEQLSSALVCSTP